MRADRCNKHFSIELLLNDKMVTISEDVVSSFFGENVCDKCQINEGKEKLIECLLFTEDVDYTITNKNVVTEMKKH